VVYPRSDGLGMTDCEAVRHAVVAQPVNATTSLAFMAGSLVVLARGDEWRLCPRPDREPMCRPESLLQAHGLWHLLAAAAFTAWAGALWTRAGTW
jgi:hypothetical protein